MRVKLNESGYTKIYAETDLGMTAKSIVGDYNTDEEVSIFIANGGVIESEFTDEELINRIISNGEVLIDTYIQKEVVLFNKTNGTKFSDIHAMANYKDSTIYTHAQMCKALWDWNELVWMKARESQEQAVIDGLTSDEFLNLLPTFGE